MLECEAEGDKPLSLHWLRNNSRLERKDGPRYYIIWKSRSRLVAGWW